MTFYNPANWYWAVGDKGGQVYSSASAAYVPISDATYAAWLALGHKPTQIDNETDLQAVLAEQYPPGWKSPQIATHI